MWELDQKENWAPKKWCCSAAEGLRVPGTARRSNQSVLKDWRILRNINWKDWCWSWSSNNLANCCKEPTHWKRPWCWERLKAGVEGRGWDGWMASLTQWTWFWASSMRQWRTRRPSMLQYMGLQRVGHDWAIEQQLFLWGHGATSALSRTSSLFSVSVEVIVI